jgi:molecular chaperone GrpE (heat shock protein)
MEAKERNKNQQAGEEPSEIDRLKEEVRREHDMYLRALADHDNYRRRVERERAGAARSGKREVILSLTSSTASTGRCSIWTMRPRRWWKASRRCNGNCSACWPPMA